MEIYLERENKYAKVKSKNLTVKTLLNELGINPSTVLVVRNDELVTADAKLSAKDKIRILSVISGG